MKIGTVVKTITIEVMNTIKCALNDETVTRDQALFLLGSTQTSIATFYMMKELYPEEFKPRDSLIPILSREFMSPLARKHSIEMLVILDRLEKAHETALQGITATVMKHEADQQFPSRN